MALTSQQLQEARQSYQETPTTVPSAVVGMTPSQLAQARQTYPTPPSMGNYLQKYLIHPDIAIAHGLGALTRGAIRGVEEPVAGLLSRISQLAPVPPQIQQTMPDILRGRLSGLMQPEEPGLIFKGGEIGAQIAPLALGGYGAAKLLGRYGAAKLLGRGAMKLPGMRAIPDFLRKVYTKIEPTEIPLEGPLEVTDTKAATIRQNLWPGTMNEASKSIAKDINASYKGLQKASSQNYKPIMAQHGKDIIYGAKLPKKSYFNLDQRILDNLSPGAKKVANEFESNPSLQNAHQLQSELGHFVADHSVGIPTSSDRLLASYGRNARDAVKNDITMFLKRKDPSGGLVNKYQAASDFHRDRVAPYYQGTQIPALAKAKKVNPGNITTIFKNPEAATQQVVDDLPQGTLNKLLYHKLGTQTASASATNTVKAFDRLDEQGFGSYVTPKLQRQMEDLKESMARNEAIKVRNESIKELNLAEKARVKDFQKWQNKMKGRISKGGWAAGGVGAATIGIPWAHHLLRGVI